jgi:hypothetical protein
MIHILRQNEDILKEKCDKMYNWIESYLDLTNYEDKNLFQIDVSKDKIEKDSFNEIELIALNILIPQLKQKLNELTIGRGMKTVIKLIISINLILIYFNLFSRLVIIKKV